MNSLKRLQLAVGILSDKPYIVMASTLPGNTNKFALSIEELRGWLLNPATEAEILAYVVENR